MEIDNIYNMDCLEGMKRIADGAVDCIITDLPYGVLNEQQCRQAVDEIEKRIDQLKTETSIS